MNIPQAKYPMISSFHLAKFYFGTEKAFVADFQHATTSSHQMASFEWLGHDLAADVVVKPSGKRSGFAVAQVNYQQHLGAVRESMANGKLEANLRESRQVGTNRNFCRSWD